MKNAIIASIIVGGAITILSIAFARPFLRLTGAKDDTIDLAVRYFRIVSSILIFNYIRVGLCAALRAEAGVYEGMRGFRRGQSDPPRAGEPRHGGRRGERGGAGGAAGILCAADFQQAAAP